MNSFDHDRAEQRSIDLSQVVSTEYRADAVVVLHDRSNATAQHHKLACPVVLIVLTPSRKVGRWARRPIHLGHPGFRLRPVVMELQHVPRFVDPAEIQKIPELAVLSAMANPDLEVATAALSVVSVLPEDRARLYLDVILAALPPSVRKALEARMQGYVYKSEFARKYYSQGLEEGLRSAVVALIRAKLDAVTREDEAAIEAVHDERALTELIGVLVRTTSAKKVRAALAAARTGG